MFNLTLFICFTLFLQAVCQTCKKNVGNMPKVEVIVKSPVVVEASIQSNLEKKKLHNATAKITKIFPSRNGNLKVGSSIMFGPVGKLQNCTNLKVKKKYILFLNKSVNGDFNWITYNPLQSNKKSIRLLRKKFLCRKCLISAFFAKHNKTMQKVVSNGLRIPCKVRGKPRPKLTLYYNNKLLTQKNPPKNIELKIGKKGDSATIKIKHLDLSNHNDVFICSGKNIVSENVVNYTVYLEVKTHKHPTCNNTCSEKYKDHCLNDGCCQENINGSPACICRNNWTGKRCDKYNYQNVLKVENKINFDYQKRVTAILGLCLSLMMVVFLCFSVYYVIKSKRYKRLLEKNKQNRFTLSKVPDAKSSLCSNHEVFFKGNMRETNLNDIDTTNESLLNYTQNVNLNVRVENNLSPNYRSRLKGIAKNVSTTKSQK